jgi:hypothetical protein
MDCPHCGKGFHDRWNQVHVQTINEEAERAYPVTPPSDWTCRLHWADLPIFQITPLQHAPMGDFVYPRALVGQCLR